jgi:hypothetical protein
MVQIKRVGGRRWLDERALEGYGANRMVERLLMLWGSLVGWKLNDMTPSAGHEGTRLHLFIDRRNLVWQRHAMGRSRAPKE